MGELTVPRLNSTDDSYVLVEWLAAAGDAVDVGDVVATVETSKAVTDLTAEAAGFLSHELPPSSVCRPGDVAGRLWSTAGEALARPAAPPPRPAEPVTPAPADASTVITRGARELMQRHGITEAAVEALGKRVVKQADVESLVGAVEAPGVPLPAHQRAVAQAVSQSHATIPAAFTVVKISAEELRRRRRSLGERTRTAVGTTELLVAAVAALRPRFPLFFAKVRDDLAVTTMDRSDVGVTLDVGRGLSIGVVHDEVALDPTAAANRLMTLRLRAMRGTLREDDLAGPTIVVSLHTEPGVVLAQPIILPGLSCTLSVAGMQQELRLDADGRPVPHEYLYVGVAYDHRVINGADAVAFLTALRDDLETRPTDPTGTSTSGTNGV
ncbi:2-oxo acid dehydrogenase subunit E2 [Plantactinospora sp. S1510]|uniref:Dihydrolipoamide acetyltransferase component of pyruvate dehydrogenase complex n=1 Tax=Plantactinospora alkalitolerans TaxID=2789879 RepID=A0ABS0H3W6_9ACTN|nr:2-oxo acid dehydrogenase subunit E2 [Plantactinospora alkalitolerans]MBF9132807.1 2-oxo acid dehydrogenase subunit E2 [Plantactinospora alkalitolerans]